MNLGSVQSRFTRCDLLAKQHRRATRKCILIPDLRSIRETIPMNDSETVLKRNRFFFTKAGR